MQRCLYKVHSQDDKSLVQTSSLVIVVTWQPLPSFVKSPQVGPKPKLDLIQACGLALNSSR
jgi:hypothetical protein